ncbi:hypothetical protein [Bizionia myxarmorum]|uniref:Uncharacterized protein n=1 Tax=Bizionia myxarmorum TaxID=291186 RepID=A0A5D0RDX7_9FLAO|nr:hypothetical protein [Bizionia myxarmorum]TYB78955.1 hypothetical protein ES674_04045 [Bizionia myxarmorum]
MKTTIYILFFIFNVNAYGQEASHVNQNNIIEEKMGDLDNDGIDEKVIISETNSLTDFGNVREIRILKNEEGKWVEWVKTQNAILKSEEGGMMGDPFQGIEILDGVLNISFFGGSSWKWSYTDKYRFQNNQFELIGYTSTYFKLCEHWSSVDFNLITGKLICKKEYEACENQESEIYKKENETFYKKGVYLTLENRQEKEIKIVTPIYGREIYIANGMQ